MASFIEQGENFAGSEIVLIDLDADRLELIRDLAERMARAKGVDITVSATTDRRAGLDGCDAILTSYRPGGFEARVLDEKIPLRHGVIGQETQGPGGFFMALRSIARDAGDPRGRRGRLPRRADLQLHEPGQHRRPGGHRPLRGPVRLAVRGPDRVPGGGRGGGGARPGAARRRQRRPQPRRPGACATPTTARTCCRCCRRRARAAATTRSSTRRRAGCCGWRPSWAPCRASTSSTTTSRTRSWASCTSKPTTRAEDILGWVPGYWEHYVEQARSDRPVARPGPLARRHPRARAGHRLHGRRLQRPRRDAAGQRAQPGLGPRLPRHARGRDARPLRRRAGSRRSRCPGLPTHLRGPRRGARRVPAGRRRRRLVGRRARRRAGARRAPARALDRPRRAALRGDGRRAPRAPARRGSCRRSGRGSERLARLGVEQVHRLGRHDELDRLAGREAPPALDARGEARAVVGGEQRRVARPRSPRRRRRPPRPPGCCASTGKITWLSAPSRSTTSSSARSRGGVASPRRARRAAGRCGRMPAITGPSRRGARSAAASRSPATRSRARRARRRRRGSSRGEPMNAATNTFAGASNSRSGVSHCCTVPSRSTATRSPSVIASTWSCVT